MSLASSQRRASSDAGERTPQVQAENYSYSSLKVATTDEVEIRSSKDYHDSHSNHVSKLHRLSSR